MTNMTNKFTEIIDAQSYNYKLVSEADNYQLNLKSEVNDAMFCLSSCVNNYTTAELISVERTCVRNCMYNQIENKYLEKIIK